MLAGLVCPFEVSIIKCCCCFWCAFLNFYAHVVVVFLKIHTRIKDVLARWPRSPQSFGDHHLIGYDPLLFAALFYCVSEFYVRSVALGLNSETHTE
jgi:hypothetical protein